MSYGLKIYNDASSLQIDSDLSCFQEVFRGYTRLGGSNNTPAPYYVVPASARLITGIRIPITSSNYAFCFAEYHDGTSLQVNAYRRDQADNKSQTVELECVHYRLSEEIPFIDPQNYGLRVYNEGGGQVYSSEYRYAKIMQVSNITIGDIRVNGYLDFSVPPPRPGYDLFVTNTAKVLTTAFKPGGATGNTFYATQIRRLNENTYRLAEIKHGGVSSNLFPTGYAPSWTTIPYYILEVPVND